MREVRKRSFLSFPYLDRSGEVSRIILKMQIIIYFEIKLGNNFTIANEYERSTGCDDMWIIMFKLFTKLHM